MGRRVALGRDTQWPITSASRSLRQGKLRGLEFKPLFFRFENHSCEAIKDKKGREVIIPTLVPLSIAESAIRIVEKKQATKGEPTESQIMQKAILDAYDILAENGEFSTGLNGKPVVKVSVKALTAEVKSRASLAPTRRATSTQRRCPTSATPSRSRLTQTRSSRTMV